MIRSKVTCAALLVPLLASVAVGGANGAEAKRCVSFKVAARIGGASVCLAAGERCQTNHRLGYARSGLRCRTGRLEYDWEPLRRPLHLPAIQPGASCPATPAGPRGFGPGPAYPTLGMSSHAAIRVTWESNPYVGWSGTKVLWRVPAYAGAVLVRGRQLDGGGTVGFDLGPQWTRRVLAEIKLVGPHPLRPAASFVRASGCYAYQVDTLRSSYQIVFAAQTE